MTSNELLARAERLRKNVGFSSSLFQGVDGQIGSAEVNAQDTLAGRSDLDHDAVQVELERLFWATLESNLCHERDAKVCAWFKKAGVRW